jgi:DNA-binding NtrC family response regulator
VTGTPDLGRPRIAVVADDLIWATRLVDGVRRAGGEPVAIRSPAALEATLPTVRGAIVDLTARAYDGIATVALAAATAIQVIAVGQHDDAETRRAAMAAGASRVYAYRALFEHGDRVLGAWIETIAPTAQSPDTTEAPMPVKTTPEGVA